MLGGDRMPIGLIVNCCAGFAGILCGTLAGGLIPQENKNDLNVLFGFCAMAIGINSVIKVHAMAVVVLATLFGFVLGGLLHLEKNAIRFFAWLVRTLHLGGKNTDMDLYITAVALFCCSGFGWYAVLTEAIAGDPSILFSKAVLDFFTAAVFAATLGRSMCAITPVQAVCLGLVFLAGRLLAPWVTTEMMADLTACGGLLTIVTGFRVSRIKSMPLVDMMPALLLVLPLSRLWSLIF